MVSGTNADKSGIYTQYVLVGCFCTVLDILSFQMVASIDSGSLPWVYAGSFVVAFLYIRSRVRYSAVSGSLYTRVPPMHESEFVLGRPQYDSIPSVGYSSPLLSYITALQFYVSPNKFLEEGYAKVSIDSLLLCRSAEFNLVVVS